METKLRLDGHGRPVLVRRAPAGPEATRLAREVAVVRRIDDPGTTRIAGVTHEPDGALVVATAVPTGGSLADDGATPRPPHRVAALLAAVATTLARAHRAGVVHGHLAAPLVLLDGSGAPLVDGWADAGDLLDEPAADPAVDVAAVGALLRDLAGETAGSEPLVALAERASADDPRARPTMAALGAALAALADELSSATPTDRRGRGPGRPRRVVEALGTLTTAAVVALVVVLVAVVPDERASAPPPPRTPHDGDAGAAAGTAEEATASWTTVPAPTCLPTAAGACPAPVEVVDGDVRAGASTWSVAGPDDVVVLGRWRCTDLPTPAVLRADGDLWLYPRWATQGEEVAARPLGVVPDAVDLAVLDDDHDGCHELGVRRRDGSTTVVDLATHD